LGPAHPDGRGRGAAHGLCLEQRQPPAPRRLGPGANIQDRGTGWGYQLEASFRYDVTPNWSAGAGVRYWYAQVDGESEFLNFDVEVPLEDFTSERFGVYGEIAYRFATF
jgi:hypothetical protein